MIKNSDAIILGGNVFGLYAGILLEKNGIDVTVIENDLFNSVMSIGPMFFNMFSGGIMEKIGERSLSIYREIMKRNWDGSLIWPIDLYDGLRKKFNGHILNFVNVQNLVKNGNDVIGIKTDHGVIDTEMVLVMDGIISKDLLSKNKIEIGSEIIDYGNILAELNGKHKVSMSNENIFFTDGNFAFLSAPWKNSRVEFLAGLFNNVAETYPGMQDCLLRRFWKSRHDLFRDWMPRVGNILFSNAYFIAGYSRYGISSGLELSRLITQIALGKPADFDFSEISF